MAFQSFTFKLPSREDYELFLSRAIIRLAWHRRDLRLCKCEEDKARLEMLIVYQKLHITSLQEEYREFYGDLPKAYAANHLPRV
jgi:hypothetical protein